jgi:DNA-binding CsgD family transcriptional regulator
MTTDLDQAAFARTPDCNPMRIGDFDGRVAPTAWEGRLTAREVKILKLLLIGQDLGEIAEALRESLPTVEADCRHVYETFGVHNRLELAKRVAHATSSADGASDAWYRDSAELRQWGRRLIFITTGIAFTMVLGGCLLVGLSLRRSAEAGAAISGIYGYLLWRFIARRLNWDHEEAELLGQPTSSGLEVADGAGSRP